jgi:hypothetical protein
LFQFFFVRKFFRLGQLTEFRHVDSGVFEKSAPPSVQIVDDPAHLVVHSQRLA